MTTNKITKKDMVEAITDHLSAQSKLMTNLKKASEERLQEFAKNRKKEMKKQRAIDKKAREKREEEYREKMSHIVILSGECSAVRTTPQVSLNMLNRICKVICGNGEIYFRITGETATSISGSRLQRDQYDTNKFYETNEKNKWHGIITDGPFTKGRRIYVYN